MNTLKIARAFAAALVVAGSLVMGGCDKKDDKGPSTSAGGGDKPLTVGFIYIGTKDDYGYSQAHHEGAMAVAKMPGVKVVEQESVQETDQVVQSMEGMINNEEAKLIFPTSFGYYDPYMKALQVRRSGQLRQLLRLHRRGRVHVRHRVGRCEQDGQAGVRRGDPDPAGPPEHQRIPAGGANDESEGDGVGDLYGRVVEDRGGNPGGQQFG